MSVLNSDNYFLQFPEKILGQAYKTTGLHGIVTKYSGDISTLDKIPVIDYQVADILSPFVSSEHTDIIKITKPRHRKNITKAIAKAEKEIKIRQQTPQKLDLISFEEIDEKYNKHLSKDQKMAFVYYQNVVLNRPMNGGWSKYHLNRHDSEMPYTETIIRWVKEGILCYDNGVLVPAFIFYSGNVYEKMNQLESNQDNIIQAYGEEAFDNQVRLLQEKIKSLYERRLTLDDPNINRRLKILPISDFATEFKISGLKGDVILEERISERKKDYGTPDYLNTNDRRKKEKINSITLQGAFVLWMKNNSRHIKFNRNSNWKEITQLYLANKKFSEKTDGNVTEFKKRKSISKAEGNRLFAEFLANEININDKVKIETVWNHTFNADVPIDLNLVPIGFEMARYYNGIEMDIRPEKREAIAFAMMEGSGCLAYGVGFGKTWAAIFILAQFLENGWCKRPSLALPNQVYPQFMSEIQGILPQIPINDFYNLGDKYLAKAKAGLVAPHSITLFTYEGFKRVGIDPSGEKEFFDNLQNILSQEGTKELSMKKMAKKMEREKNKIEGIIGKALMSTFIDIQELGLDMLVLDEAHSAKKIFTNVKAKEGSDLGKKSTHQRYLISSGTQSSMGIKTFMLSQFIQKNNPTGNVILLTATPFTNSPLEVFSMLALVAIEKMKKIRYKGSQLSNIADFFDQFIDVKNELVIKADLNPAYKEIFTGFNNLPGLQKLIRRFFLYKQGLTNLKRPNKIVLPLQGAKIVDQGILKLNAGEKVDTIVELSPIQEVMMKDIIEFAEGKKDLLQKLITDKGVTYGCIDEFSKEHQEAEKAQFDLAKKIENDEVGDVEERHLDNDSKTGVRMLQAVNFARSLALSPYLYKCNGFRSAPTYLEYIETSNKLKYTMECIKSVKEYHEKKGEPISGQVVYMNRGVEYFQLIKEYLVKEVGFKDHEVGIIASKSTMSQFKMGDKSEVQDKFLGRVFNNKTRLYDDLPDEERMKVLIGSSSIKEGINLQKYSTVLYNLFLDWNPTDVIQLEGRIWRQGNLFKNVRIVNPLMEDSMDIFMFQKLDEKTQRINAIWDFDGNETTLNVEEFDPSELKYAIIKDPYRLAKIEAQEKTTVMDDLISDDEYQIKIIEDFKEIKSSIFKKSESLWDFVNRYRDVDFSETKNPEKIKRRVLEIIKSQTLKDGTPARDSKKYDYKYGLSSGVISEPWGFREFVDNLRKYQRTVKNVLKPNNFTDDDNDLKIAIEKIKEQLEAKKEEKKKLTSDEMIEKRAKEIIEQRVKNNYQSGTVTERVNDFKKLNYLLSERKFITKPVEVKAKPKKSISLKLKLLKLRQQQIAIKAKVEIELALALNGKTAA